ncbi:hypothetical protein [Sphingomonas sp. DC2300-3]|uniref:hypothetical protein n=1 Tax=unclassified Sphingomonas TaxID=196159 RepID=UPI003CFB0357
MDIQLNNGPITSHGSVVVVPTDRIEVTAHGQRFAFVRTHKLAAISPDDSALVVIETAAGSGTGAHTAGREKGRTSSGHSEYDVRWSLIQHGHHEELATLTFSIVVQPLPHDQRTPPSK